jgi:hypothetical protein
VREIQVGNLHVLIEGGKPMHPAVIAGSLSLSK